MKRCTCGRPLAPLEIRVSLTDEQWFELIRMHNEAPIEPIEPLPYPLGALVEREDEEPPE